MAAIIVSRILILVMAMALSTPSSFAGSPVVNFINEMDGSAQPPSVDFVCKQGGLSRARFNLVPGQKHSFEATLKGVYDCDVYWGWLFGSVEGFKPSRDKGQNTVNWKVDEQGLSLSCDLKSWELVEPWEID